MYHAIYWKKKKYFRFYNIFSPASSHPSLAAFHLAACHSVGTMRLCDSHKNRHSYRSSTPEGMSYNPLYGRGQSVTDNLIWRSSLIFLPQSRLGCHLPLTSNYLATATITQRNQHLDSLCAI